MVGLDPTISGRPARDPRVKPEDDDENAAAVLSTRSLSRHAGLEPASHFYFLPSGNGAPGHARDDVEGKAVMVGLDPTISGRPARDPRVKPEDDVNGFCD
jgi:hypothetical protein